MKEPTKNIRILIMDKNVFFVKGLSQVLFDFYHTKNIHVQFIARHSSTLTVDIIFQAVGYEVTVDIWRYFSRKAPQPLFFVIRDESDILLARVFQSVQENRVIYRHLSIDAIKQKLEVAMFVQQHHSPREVPGNRNVIDKKITRRECEVLRHIKQGMPQKDIAKIMCLKVKTISSHKRSAMRKLNFKRNHELFHWMLLGGLSSQEREI